MASHGPSPSIRTGTPATRSAPRSGPRLVGALAALVAVLALAGCVGEPPEVTVDDPELVAGRAVYGAHCASCHGSDGGGGLGTRLSEGATVAAFPDLEEQIAMVADGRGQMPAFVGRLTDEELRAVVRYTREVL